MLTKDFLFSIGLLISMFTIRPVYADVLIRPAFSYSIDKDQTSSTTTTTRQMIDLAGGYIATEGWAILGMYSIENKKTDTGNSTSNSDRTSYGAGGGWYSREAMGPYVDAIYHLNSKLMLGSTKYQGTGWQVDVGYQFQISGAVSFGVQLAYSNFVYTKLDGTALTPPDTRTNLDPMLALVIIF